MKDELTHGFPVRCGTDFCANEATWIVLRREDSTAWTLVCDEHERKYADQHPESRHIKRLTVVTDKTIRSGFLMEWTHEPAE